MKRSWPRVACSTTSTKRIRNEEEPEPKLALVACTSEEKGKGVMVEEEESMGLDDDKIEVEEWEHSIMSESSDDERTYPYKDEIRVLSEEDAWQYPTIEREFYKDLYRRAFIVTGEKYLKLARQDEIRMEFKVLLTRRPDITHESIAEDVYQKLESESLIRMPKKFALPLIGGAIRTRSYFHEIDHRFKLVKKLITMVPCITRRTDEDLLTEYLHQTGISCDFNDYVISNAITDFSYIVANFEESFHPVIRKDRIKVMIAYADIYCKQGRRRIIKHRRKDRVAPRYAKYLKKVEEEYESSEVYQESLKVVQLHQEFHEHVASCNFIKHNMKIKELIKDKRVVKTRFKILEQSLIIATLKARMSLLKEMDEFARYKAWLKCIVAERINLGRSRMDDILDLIRANHPTFPRLSDKWAFVDLKYLPLDWTNDQKEEEMCAFYELLDQVKVHTNCEVSYGYLIEGILKYLKFCSWHKKTGEQQVTDIFDIVVSLKKKVWNEAFYDHKSYKDVYEDMSTVFA